MKNSKWLTPTILAFSLAKVGRLLEVRSFETSLGNMAKPCLYKKNIKITQAWSRVPVVPATQEAEVGNLLELGRLRL